MKSFFKLSIAAVLVGAMSWSATAFAMEVAKTDAGVPLSLSGYGAVTFGFLTPNEVGGEAPPSTFATATDVRFTAEWGTEDVMAHWTKWIRDIDGQAGNITQDMGWVTWSPGQLRIDVGNIGYVPWGDRAILWENYYTVDSIHQTYTYAGYVEDVNGLDVGFDVGGGIEVGAGIFSQGLVTGTKNQVPAGSVANTYAVHLVWKAEAMSLRAAFFSETAESAVDDPTTDAVETNWADSESVSNTLISVTFKIDVGVKIGVTFNTVDGDAYDAVDPWTSISPSVRVPLGDNEFGVEAELATNGGVDDKGEQADTMYARVFYQMPIAAASFWQVEYDIKDDAISTGSMLGLNFKQSF